MRMANAQTPPVDKPISSAVEDAIGRAVVAHDFARSVRELDVSNGVVVGVLGAWGHGKTSFVNLMKEQFATEPELVVVEFNPWLFSGTQPLTDVFFREIAAELRVEDRSRFETIAEGLNKYGDVLSPVAVIPFVGGWWDRAYRATKTLANWWADRKKGSRTFRTTVTDALSELDHPIVVVIDDIDRLHTSEIRDIFKLVRLTASFPNVVYLLAFDRVRVEQALTEEGVSGRSYLEKIVQLSFDLPAIPHEMLRAEVFEKLNVVLDGVEELRFDQGAWTDVYVEIVEPLIANLRDVTRLALSSAPTVRALGADIEGVDLLALESVRVFRPEIFGALQRVRTSLTEIPDNSFGRSDTSRQQAEIDGLLEIAGSNADLVRQLIRRLFPAARRYIENNQYGRNSQAVWLREHRVAHISFLDLYFSRAAPSDLRSFRNAERASTLLNDATALGAFLDSLPIDELEDAISGLEAYQDEYPSDAVVPACVTLLNRIHLIPDRPRAFFDPMRPDIVVGRVVLRLLSRIDDPVDREQAVRTILPDLITYSAREDLIRTVGYREGSGHRLVPEQVATELEETLIQQIRESPHSAAPQAEWNLARVHWLVAESLATEYTAPQFVDPTEVRALLFSAKTTARRQSGDSRAVHEEGRLWWGALVQIFGDESALVTAIELLKAVDGDTELVQLAEQYAGGWRPSEDSF